jgi:dTDP-4-amino-4,6-dideoxygalactose transaminase
MSVSMQPQALPKLASDPVNFVRPTRCFPSARAAFAAWLQAIGVGPDDTVLLPAYIGWSSREGSGVFDPILQIGCRYAFYRLDRELHIDLDHVAAQLEKHRPKVAVVIHYFGYPDLQLSGFVKLARNYGVYVLEDEAHALLTDWVSGLTGRLGDAAIASLHKLLPVPDGGLLILNSGDSSLLDQLPPSSNLECYRLMAYDFPGIAGARRRNAQTLLSFLAPLTGEVDPLIPALPDGVAPQTFPVIVRNAARDQLYFDLNAAGFGVVSLYHTLVDAVSAENFPDSHWLAKRIMNLPVHQDVTPELLQQLVARLARLL